MKSDNTINVISLKQAGFEIDNLLDSMSFFSWMGSEHKSQIKKNIEVVFLEGNDILLEQGEDSDYFYIVYGGNLLAYIKNGDKKEKIIGFIGKGEMIGEMTILDKTKRTLNIRAIRNSVLLRIPNAVIHQFMKDNFDCSIKITSTIIQRMKQLLMDAPLQHLYQHPKIITIMPSGAFQQMNNFSEKFQRVLGKEKKLIELRLDNINTFNSDLKNSYSDKMKWKVIASNLLMDLERDYEFVILNASLEDKDWGTFCLNNADLILMIANSQAESDLNALETQLFSKEFSKNVTSKHLVLIQPEDILLPCHTNRWWANRVLTRIHHIQLEKEITIRRLTRLVTNESVGIALSGGGANGFAHIGVLKALEEHHIEVDTICGVSAGAVIGGLYAQGKSLDEIKELFYKFIRTPMSSTIFSLQFPIASILKPTFFEKRIRHIFGDIDLEDLWINYFCLASNLITVKSDIFNKGPLIKPVTASCSIPGTLSPVPINNGLYIDGGAENTMPGDILKEQLIKNVIGVNVSRGRLISIDSRVEKFPSTLDILFEWLNPFKPKRKVPYLNEILNRSLVFGNKKKLLEVKELIDYYIEPDLRDFGVQDYKKKDIIMEIGYLEANRVLANFNKEKEETNTPSS